MTTDPSATVTDAYHTMIEAHLAAIAALEPDQRERRAAHLEAAEALLRAPRAGEREAEGVPETRS